jgi:hypothetical protein
VTPTRPLVLLCLLAAGCAAPGSLGYESSIETGGSGASSCEVSASDLLDTQRVTVRSDWAVSDSLLGERRIARIEEDGSIIVDGLLISSHKGSFSDGRLVIHGLVTNTTSDPIEGGEVRFPGLVFPTVYRYSPGCSPRSAALGALALHVLREEESSKAGASAGQ